MENIEQDSIEKLVSGVKRICKDKKVIAGVIAIALLGVVYYCLKDYKFGMSEREHEEHIVQISQSILSQRRQYTNATYRIRW